MGWLFGKKKDGLYRGDAPATSPGLDGVDPAAYQGSTAYQDSTSYQDSAGSPASASTRPYDPVPPAASTPYQPTPYQPTPNQPTPYQPTPYQPTPYQPVPDPRLSAAPGTSQPYAQGGAAPGGQPYVQANQDQMAQLFSAVSAAASRPGTGLPPEVATAMAYAQNQRQTIKRTVGRSLFGALVPLLLVGGLVVVGFVVVDKFENEISNVFDPGGSDPGQGFAGVIGEAAAVTLGDNSYQITIQSATAQPSAAWGSIFTSTSGGFLVIELSLTRTDTSSDVSQISWFDWTFTAESGAPLEGALIAGGYEPLLSTLILQPDQTATGLIAFDTTESVGTLSLTNFDGTWASWPIAAATPAVPVGEFGVMVRPEAAQAPFTVAVANPRWIAAGDPGIRIAPASGGYLILDMGVTADESALTAASSLSFSYRNWQFTPTGGTAVASGFGVMGTDILSFGPGQPTTGTLIAFDAPRAAGTLDLLNADGSVLVSWAIPAV